MKFSRRLSQSTGATILAGALLVLPLAAQTQDHAPSPDEYAAQLAAQNGQNGAQQYPNQDPNGQYGPPAGQNGAPTGVGQAPPAIPDYQQPEAPGDGYIWTPGYWAWTADGYQWVDGAWVVAPYTGALWTPGYWGYADSGYFWNTGYWGPTVGYYGGINYGFGYFGIGFYGGYWGGGRFWYNRAYCNIGFGRGFGVYNRSFNGYSGRPGGNSFVRAGYNGGRVGVGAGFAANRGSTINGAARSSNLQASNRSAGNGYANGAARSYAGGSNYSGASRSYAQPAAQSHANYGGGGGAVAHSAPSGGGGGGFHGGGGGGGGSHGGGGHR